MNRTLVLAAGLALALPVALPAQQQPRIFQPGARVRVVAPVLSGEKIAGTVVSVSDNWMHLSSGKEGAERWVHLSVVDSVELSMGKNRRRRAFKASTWGGFLGVGAGVITGALVARNLPTGVATSAVLGAVGVGLLGGGIGAGIGALTPRETWRPYPVAYTPATTSQRPSTGTR